MDNKQIKPNDFKLGEKDNSGAVIKKIYFCRSEYIVYRTDNSIKLDVDDDCKELDQYLNNHYKIGVDTARIYSWLPEDLSWTESINRQIARAIATNVAGNYDDAKKMLSHAQERILKLRTIQGRLQYTLSAFVFVGLIFIISLALQATSYSVLANVVLCGGLGGVLSVATGFSSLDIDVDANLATNSLIGGSRILIAITAALFAYFAIQTDFAFSFVKDEEGNHGIYMMAMVAGFVEMLVPNIMNNLAKENGVDQDDKAKA